MNLHGIAAPYISAVNPMTPATVQISDGYCIDDAGRQVPKYLIPSIPVLAQVQPMSSRDLQHSELMNLQGELVAIYVNGKLDGLVRVDRKGGDIITIPGGASKGIYLVNLVLEQWPDWVKVAATMQNDRGIKT